MATTYDFVAVNKRRSVILIAVFIVILGLVGYAFMKLLETGPAGLILAIIIAVIMSLVGYFNGDKIALVTAGAQGPLKPGENDYLYRLIENLCISNGQPLPAIYLINDQQINAFATGRDPQHASVAITTGALTKLENEELEGVLAHELSHIKNYDIRYMTLVVILVGILTLLSQFFWRANMFGGRRSDNNRSGGQLQAILMIVGLVLLIIAPLLGQLIQLAVSRKREFLADASGALLTRYPEGLARALEKIEIQSTAPLHSANQATAHLYFSNPFGSKSGGLNKFFRTHPPIAERIAALRAMGNTRA